MPTKWTRNTTVLIEPVLHVGKKRGGPASRFLLHDSEELALMRQLIDELMGGRVVSKDAIARAARRFGVMIPVRDAPPGHIAFAPTLDDANLEQLSNAHREAATASSRRALGVNPRMIFQSDDRVPAEVVARAGSSLDASWIPAPPVVWVEEPRWKTLWPVKLSRSQLAAVKRLAAGQTSPDEIDAALRFALVCAQILLPRSRTKEVDVTRDRERYADRGYLVFRSLINPVTLAGMRRYFEECRQHGRYQMDPRMMYRASRMYGDPIVHYTQAQFATVLSRSVRQKTVPTFCFAFNYQAGSVLQKHRDRPQCHWNASLLIGASPDVGREGAWPLYLEHRGRVHHAKLGAGDAVVYSGTNSTHWRKPLEDGHSVEVATLHFVPQSFTGDLR